MIYFPGQCGLLRAHLQPHAPRDTREGVNWLLPLSRRDRSLGTGLGRDAHLIRKQLSTSRNEHVIKQVGASGFLTLLSLIALTFSAFFLLALCS